MTMKFYKETLALCVGAVMAASSITSYAGGFDTMAAPAPTKGPYLYEQVGVAYAQTRYADHFNSADWTDTTNENGGAGYAGAVGLQLKKSIALELGLGYLPKASYTGSPIDTSRSSGGGKIKSWYGYFAARYSYSLRDNLDLFAKGGLAYRAVQQRIQPSGGIVIYYNDDHYYAPLFGIGATYHLKYNFYTGVEYQYLGGTSDSNMSYSYPNANIFLLNFGYNFKC